MAQRRLLPYSVAAATALLLWTTACGGGRDDKTKRGESSEASADAFGLGDFVPVQISFAPGDGGLQLVEKAISGYTADLKEKTDDCWGPQNVTGFKDDTLAALKVRKGAKDCEIVFKELRFKESGQITAVQIVPKTPAETGLSTASVGNLGLFKPTAQPNTVDTRTLAVVVTQPLTTSNYAITLRGQESQVDVNAVDVLAPAATLTVAGRTGEYVILPNAAYTLHVSMKNVKSCTLESPNYTAVQNFAISPGEVDLPFNAGVDPRSFILNCNAGDRVLTSSVNVTPLRIDMTVEGVAGDINIGQNLPVHVNYWTFPEGSCTFTDSITSDDYNSPRGGPAAHRNYETFETPHLTVPGTRVMTVTCVNTDFNVSSSKSYNVTVWPGRATCQMSANPTTIDYNQQSTVTWTASSADVCDIQVNDNHFFYDVMGGIGTATHSRPTDQMNWPNAIGSVTYKMVCGNPAYTPDIYPCVSSVTITRRPPPPPPPTPPQPQPQPQPQPPTPPPAPTPSYPPGCNTDNWCYGIGGTNCNFWYTRDLDFAEQKVAQGLLPGRQCNNNARMTRSVLCNCPVDVNSIRLPGQYQTWCKAGPHGHVTCAVGAPPQCQPEGGVCGPKY